MLYKHGRRKGEGRGSFWKFQQKKLIFLVSSGKKKQISPVLAPLEKFWKNSPLAPPGKNYSDALVYKYNSVPAYFGINKGLNLLSADILRSLYCGIFCRPQRSCWLCIYPRYPMGGYATVPYMVHIHFLLLARGAVHLVQGVVGKHHVAPAPIALRTCHMLTSADFDITLIILVY